MRLEEVADSSFSFECYSPLLSIRAAGQEIPQRNRGEWNGRPAEREGGREMPQEENGVRGRRRRDASLPPPRRAKSQLLIPAEGVGDSIPPQHSHHGTFVFLISRKTRERGARRKRWFQKFDDHNLSFSFPLSFPECLSLCSSSSPT